VIGLLLCAMGVNRDSAASVLATLGCLEMGVRVDRAGVSDWDYHTAGAGIGIRKAEGGVKLTATTKEPETLLSRRQYLLDASFLVVLLGDQQVIGKAAEALINPVWPFFLGRKCCVPSEPVLVGVGQHTDMNVALESLPCFVESAKPNQTIELDAFVEHRSGTLPPAEARLVHDVPRTLRNPSHGPRWVVPVKVRARCEQMPLPDRMGSNRRPVDYTSAQWRAVRAERLRFDGGLCVFCKSEAKEVHHVTYESAGHERIEHLRSLCNTCHDACTQLEYGSDMREYRIDPGDPSQRDLIARQIDRLMSGRRLSVRRRIQQQTRLGIPDFMTDAPS
jgi:CRISPR-associated protein Cas5/CasD subtype I-E